MVKHVEGWNLTQQLNCNQKVYVRNFPSAKVKYTKDYVKPCIRENNPDHVIIHVGTNDLNSPAAPERIARSIVDLARNIKTENRSMNISGIVPRNGSLNNKALEGNQELLNMFKEAKFDYIDHKNKNLRTHLNKSRLYFQSRFCVNEEKQFSKQIRESHIKNKQTESSVDKNEMVYFGVKLHNFRVNHLNKIIIADLSINSIRNKFNYSVERIKNYIDI